MKFVIATALIVIALAWAGGELHRSNCIDQGHTGCSVLPWDNGHTTKPRPKQLSELQRLQKKYGLKP